MKPFVFQGKHDVQQKAGLLAAKAAQRSEIVPEQGVWLRKIVSEHQDLGATVFQAELPESDPGSMLQAASAGNACGYLISAPMERPQGGAVVNRLSKEGGANNVYPVIHNPYTRTNKSSD